MSEWFLDHRLEYDRSISIAKHCAKNRYHKFVYAPCFHLSKFPLQMLDIRQAIVWPEYDHLGDNGSSCSGLDPIKLVEKSGQK